MVLNSRRVKDIKPGEHFRLEKDRLVGSDILYVKTDVDNNVTFTQTVLVVNTIHKMHPELVIWDGPGFDYEH